MNEAGPGPVPEGGGAGSGVPGLGEGLSILDMSPDAVILANPEGRIVAFSRGAEATFGYEAAEVLGHEIEVLMPARFRHRHQGHFAKFAAGEPAARHMSERAEIAGLRKDGTEFPAEASIARQDIDGRSVLSVMVRDISARKAAEQALRESEAQARALFEQAADAIVVIGRDGRIGEANASAAALLGCPVEELEGRSYLDFVPREMRGAVAARARRVRPGQRDEADREIVRPDGSRVTVHFTLSAMDDGRVLLAMRDLGERLAAERALRQSEERARALFEEAADAIAVITPDGIIEEVNRSAAAMLHSTTDALAMRHFREFIPAQERDATERSFRGVAAGRKIEADRELLRPDGSIVPVHLSATAISDGRVLVACRDLAERQAAERALRESEEEFRTTFENAPTGISIMDATCKRIWVNRAFCEMMGYTREELLGGNFREVTHPDDLREELPITDALARGDRLNYQMEKRYIRKDGSAVWALVAGTAVRDEQGRVLRYIAHVQDVTESRAAAQAIRESEERYRTTFESAPIGIVVRDATGGWLWVNRAFCEMVGYSREEVLATDSQHLTHPEDREAEKPFIGELVSGRRDSYEIEKRYIRKDGSLLWALVAVARVGSVEQEQPRYVAQVVDISERKRAEEALQTSEARLRESQAIARLGSWELNAATGRLECSAEVYRILEIQPRPSEDSIERLFSAIHPEDREAVRAAYTEALRLRTPYEMEHRLLMRDGRVKWVRETGQTTYSEDGRQPHTVGTVQDITERYLAEEAVRESEARLREAQAVARLGSWELDLRNNRLEWSDEIYRIFELDPARFEPSYEAFLRAVHPDDREMVDQAYRQSVMDEKAYSIEHRLQMTDGRLKWVRETGRTTYSEDGQALRSVGTVQDITQQHLAEHRRAESEELFRTTFEASPVGITITRGDRKRVWVNQAFCEMLGYSREELLDADYTAVTHPADLEADNRLFARVVGGEIDHYSIEKRYIRKNHRIIWGYLTVAAARHPVTGEPYFVNQVMDITERKLAEEALRRSEERLRSVVTSAPVVLFVLDEEGTFTFLEGHAIESLGVSQETLVGASIWEQPWMTAGMAEGVRRSLEGTPVNDVILLGDRYFDVQMTPATGNGISMGLTGVMLDVTERRSLEAQLRRSQRLESLGQLAGGIAHDFNNLLTVINGHAELLLESLPSGDELRDEVRTILEAGQRGSALTRQLLAFSRRQVVTPRVMDLNEVIANLEGMMRRLLSSRFELAARLEPGIEPISADPGQVEQVVMNLVINARDAMEQGGSVMVSTGRSAGRKGWVFLRVSDTGSGMSPGVREHIFDPFFTTKPHGTGLGLATVHGIVTQAGGQIDVESEPGQGTTFTIHFPTAQTPAAVTGRATVLILEPDEAVRGFLRTAIERGGFAALEAAGGAAALAFVQGGGVAIDVVVASLVLPGMPAPEFANRLRAAAPTIPLLFVAGYADAETAQAVADLDVEFIRKPVTAAELLARIREALEHAQTEGD